MPERRAPNPGHYIDRTKTNMPGPRPYTCICGAGPYSKLEHEAHAMNPERQTALIPEVSNA